MALRAATSTSNFGVGRREGHDASAFYARFRPPAISGDDRVAGRFALDDPFQCADARHMAALPDASVALVVTSPPYFVGKQYEEELSRDGVPATYLEYLTLLTDVFAECVRVLEPGGRIAVNVANLGRRPYRSLSADVVAILESLGLLLRGEVIWRKAEGATGSCAWGSYRSAANPVLRDLTERVVIASKGRFDRARSAQQRQAEGLPHCNTIPTDDFLAQTLDVWEIPPERATRVGHPAPFPVELPAQLIELFTYADDLVLDPFMGSGSALVAASKLGRRYVGYDLDADYVDLARRRVADEGAPIDVTPAPSAAVTAEEALVAAGFKIVGRKVKVRGTGVTVPFTVADAQGDVWLVDLGGTATRHRPGLERVEAAWRVVGRAAALAGAQPVRRVLVLTPTAPKARSDADLALRATGPGVVFDVIDTRSSTDLDRLGTYAAGGAAAPMPGFWA